MTSEIEVGFSPCPNDTFMFDAWVHDDVIGAPPVRPWLADIEELNLRALGDDPLPVTKLSAAVLGCVADRYRVSRAGAALGRGCGPLVVVREDRSDLSSLSDLVGARVAIPGKLTTANLLFAAFGPGDVELIEQRFDRVMHSVAHSACDAGVVIHESRFTYRDHGLRALADLGELWESELDLPLPLGLIAVRRDVTETERITMALRASVERARAEPARSRTYVARHAQEMDEEVCARHIELYVNDYSVDVGDDGARAVEELLRRGGGEARIPDWV